MIQTDLRILEDTKRIWRIVETQDRHRSCYDKVLQTLTDILERERSKKHQVRVQLFLEIAFLKEDINSRKKKKFSLFQ